MPATRAAQAIEFDEGLIETIAGFYADPLGFAKFNWPWGEEGPLKDEVIDDFQVDILNKIGEQVAKGGDLQEAIRLAIASGNGIGKTCLIALIIIWFVSTREFPQVVVTASTQVQLNSKTWRELAKWHRLAKNKDWFIWTATKFYHVLYPETWFASAIPWSQDNAGAFKGTHEKFVLIIFDEGDAIADIIYETMEGSLTTPGALWLVFGNYTKNTGKFNDCFVGKTKDRWIKFQIDSRTTRKANQAQIKQWIDDYGEDSDFVRIRVRGVAPRSGSNQFISQDIIASCRRYKAQGYQHLPKILSLSVARFNDDQTVCGYRRGRKFLIQAKWRGLTPDKTVDKFIDIIDDIDPDAVIVSGGGTGGAVIDLLRRANYDRRDGKKIIYEFHGKEDANNDMVYFNRRAEVWGECKDAMSDGIDLPEDNDLFADLIAPEYTFATKTGFEVIQLESQDDMRARELPSPDCAESLILTYAVKIRSSLRPRDFDSDNASIEGGPLSWLGA